MPFLSNQKGYCNSSAAHSASLFVSTTTSSHWNGPCQLALDPSRPPLLVASKFAKTVDRGMCSALERVPH